MTDPIDVSDSQEKLYLRCPRLWGYKKLLKLEVPESKDNLVMGDAIHAALEHYVLHRNVAAAQALAMQKINAGKPENIQWQLQVVPAMIMGWVTLWLPGFEQEYEIIKPEEEFSYFPHPLVKYRGKKDLLARKRSTGGILLLDYKSSGQKDGGELGEQVSVNHQLAIYSIDHMRKTGQWPAEVGLMFLQKPKKKNILDCINEARLMPSNYHEKIITVTPAFAQFAIDVEASDVLVAQQMLQYRELFRQRGLEAFTYIPPNFLNCTEYGTTCGFAAGCHVGVPCHKTLKTIPK